MDASTAKDVFLERKSDFNIEFEPKDEQISAVVSVLNHRNVVCLLPTGYGKTFCMVLPTILQIHLNPITLVISPLTSLIDDHISSLKKWNLSCAKISALSEMDEESISGIKQGDFQFVFSSPESVLKPHWKKIFMGDVWQSRLRLIVIDEAHCISEWGEDFRADYQRLNELRSFFTVSIMALTATSTNKVKADIMQHLQLYEEDTDIIFKSPDRPNIYIELRKNENSADIEVSLAWLIDHLKRNGEKAKKTIVYCRSIDRVSDIFVSVKDALGTRAYKDEAKLPENLLIEMFHKATHQDSKNRILSTFKREDSTIRCIIATVALGMGIDIRDIDLVVHYGSPKSVLSYWQEAGRCARDGRVGHSLILYDNFTLAIKSTNKDISSIIKEIRDRKDEDPKLCIRTKIIHLLSVEGVENHDNPTSCDGCDNPRCKCPACTCCNICAKFCKCYERCNFKVEEFLS